MIISEQLINKAINESLNEFMIEEGFWDGAKKVWNWASRGAGKAWNAVNNAVNMYMDSRTGGRWNDDWGSYVKGNGRTTELFYLNKWFNAHLQKITEIARQEKDPTYRTYRRYEVDKDGNRTEQVSSYDSIKKYAQDMLTPKNFNNYVMYYIPDRMALECIDTYITNNCQKKIVDLASARDNLNIQRFISTDEGKTLLGYNSETMQQARDEYLNKQPAQNTQQQVQPQGQPANQNAGQAQPNPSGGTTGQAEQAASGGTTPSQPTGGTTPPAATGTPNQSGNGQTGQPPAQPQGQQGKGQVANANPAQQQAQRNPNKGRGRGRGNRNNGRGGKNKQQANQFFKDGTSTLPGVKYNYTY